jgi:putative endopeptidase
MKARINALVCGCMVVATAAGAERYAPTMSTGLQLGSGLLLDGFDTTVRPQDDLYRFCGGTWLKKTEIPADRSDYGATTVLSDRAEENLKAILEEAQRNLSAPMAADAQKVGDFYRAYMNQAR